MYIEKALTRKKSSGVDLLQPPDLLLGPRAPLQHKAVLPRQIVERVRRPRLGRLRAQLQSRNAVRFGTLKFQNGKQPVDRGARGSRERAEWSPTISRSRSR